MEEEVIFIKQQKSILFLLVMYSVLEFTGAISFDSMYAPLLLARTGNNEAVVGIVVFFGCFGAPIYQTYQTVILRERVPVFMQGRVFSLQGMITSSLSPLGCFIGAILADYVFEPFMQNTGTLQEIFSKIVGNGKGAGMGLMFVMAGVLGIIIIIFFRNSHDIRTLEITDK